jgi:hypothetical protein
MESFTDRKSESCQDQRVLTMLLARIRFEVSQDQRQSIANFPQLSDLCDSLIDSVKQERTSYYDGESVHTLLLLELYPYTKYELSIVINKWMDELEAMIDDPYECYYLLITGMDALIERAKSTANHSNYEFSILLHWFEQFFSDFEDFDPQIQMIRIDRLRAALKINTKEI